MMPSDASGLWAQKMSSKDSSLRHDGEWRSTAGAVQDSSQEQTESTSRASGHPESERVERRVSKNRPFSKPVEERKHGDSDQARDVAQLKALLDEQFESPTNDRREMPTPKEGANRDAARRWTGRIVKTAIGLAVIAVVGVMPAQRLLQVSSVEAIVNAPLVTIRAPIDGVVGDAARRLEAGQRISSNGSLLTVTNSRVDTSRLTATTDRLDRLRAEEGANQIRLVSLEKLRVQLRQQVSDFAKSRIALVDARIAQTEARLTAAVASVEKMVGHSQLADSSDRVALSGDPDAVIAAEYVRELRSELAGYRIERDALAKGVFVGDSYNDRPQSAQRLDEVETRIAETEAELDIAKKQILWAQVAVSDERKRLAMQEETVLHAPVAGEIWEVLAAPGEHVTAGEPLVNIVDCSSPIVTAVVSEAVYNRLLPGTPAAFRFREGGEPVKGRVVLLSGMATAPASYAITPAALTRESYRVTVALNATSDGSGGCAIGRTGRVLFGRDAI